MTPNCNNVCTIFANNMFFKVLCLNLRVLCPCPFGFKHTVELLWSERTYVEYVTFQPYLIFPWMATSSSPLLFLISPKFPCPLSASFVKIDRPSQKNCAISNLQQFALCLLSCIRMSKLKEQ